MTHHPVLCEQVETLRAKVERIGGRLRLSDQSLREAAESIASAPPEEHETIVRDLVALAMLSQDVVGEGAALFIAQLAMLAGAVFEDPVEVRERFRSQGVYLDAAARALGQATDRRPTSGDAAGEDSLLSLRLGRQKKHE